MDVHQFLKKITRKRNAENEERSERFHREWTVDIKKVDGILEEAVDLFGKYVQAAPEMILENMNFCSCSWEISKNCTKYAINLKKFLNFPKILLLGLLLRF